MGTTSFDELCTRLMTETGATSADGRLEIAPAPDAWVAPPLRVLQPGNQDALAVEVIFLEASAAVGKSTLAAKLSASAKAPLLDLGRIPVSTGAMKFLISELEVIGGKPLEAFQRGALPVIVDALDEGRILSHEAGFDSFVGTLGELLMSDRSVTNRPKVVVLGRPESAELTRTLLALHSPHVTWTSLEVDYFDEPSARRMIDVHARNSKHLTSAYDKHPEPVARVINAYFGAIAAALGLSKDELWRDARGRAFAGYAPVLGAIGTLLAVVENFADLANALEGVGGANRAWSVISQVVDAITKRERLKLVSRLPESIAALPMAYDQHEQFSFLVNKVAGRRLVATKRVTFGSAQDAAKYLDAVRQYLDEHPFLRAAEFANPVLASTVVAFGIEQDLWRLGDDSRLVDAARTPFLWRAFRDRVTDESLVDGRYVGFVLGSMWTDPAERGARVAIRSRDDDRAAVIVSLPDRRTVSFEVMPPLTLHGRIVDCDIDVDAELRLVGSSGAGGRLVIDGKNQIRARAVDVSADTVLVEKSLWLDAASVSSQGRLDVRVRDDAKVGWGGKVADTYPWNRYPATLDGPATPPGSKLEWLLRECAARLGSATITLDPSYRVVDDQRLAWATRHFADEFPALMTLLVKHKLGTRDDSVSAGGEAKVRVRFGTSWSALLDEEAAPTGAGSVGAMVAEARRTIG